ncbi:hypothetical protein [Peterkaempfera bronchialis]|uniref:hypothetical protein n=1 Tax=Peterkaempfera bronchialis TaxID=2126346 RepID=UPI003C2E5F6E
MSPATKHSLRTVIQTAVSLCLLLPAVIDTADLPGSLPWATGALAVAGGLARLMALPGVQALLPSWLSTEASPNGDDALRALADAPEGGGA